MQINTDSLGIPHFSEQDLIAAIYKGHAEKIPQVLCDPTDDIKKCNEYLEAQGLEPFLLYQPVNLPKEEFDKILQSQWFMPESYQELDVAAYLLQKCSTESEKDRVNLELEEYNKKNLFNVLRYMIYLVDFMKQNNIVWGVGRGSSVASYVLYLIGIHRINSIQYDLDFYEFMR